ncbi:hypothetical protein DK870_28715, partial [Pseudomonas sp. Q1]|nr:hypothetical protein [Pseudomonas sp. Q1]
MLICASFFFSFPLLIFFRFLVAFEWASLRAFQYRSAFAESHFLFLYIEGSDRGGCPERKFRFFEIALDASAGVCRIRLPLTRDRKRKWLKLLKKSSKA